MKIHVKELGVIKEANLNLDKPLVLFCGQNNTGKTYLAYLTYALTRLRFRISPFKISVAQLVESNFYEIHIAVDEIYDYKKAIINDLRTSLDTIYGISEELAKQMFPTLEINFENDTEQCTTKIHELELNEIITYQESKFKLKKDKSSLTLRIETITGQNYTELLKEDYTDLLVAARIADRIALYPISNSVIFSVERNSIYTFSRELSLNRNLLIDQMQKLSDKKKDIDLLDFMQSSANRYPLAIRDGLSVSNDLEAIQKTKSDYFELGTEIEDKLLNGTILIGKEGSVQFVTNKNKGKKLPVHMSASIVKTLSSLIIYLKYVARYNDLIIIDEPEMNLHPDNQILLTRLFGKLLNKGFRLLISTHSDYILREFNNLIMISNTSDEVQKVAQKYAYDLSEGIKPDDVGCYYFHFPKASTRQIVVKKLKVNNTGFEVESIDIEINSQTERAMGLNYALQNKH